MLYLSENITEKCESELKIERPLSQKINYLKSLAFVITKTMFAFLSFYLLDVTINAI